MKTITLDTDPINPVQYRYPVSRVVYRGKSPYQKILVFDSPVHGRILALDNRMMLSTREELYYHESIVHPIVQAHPDPRNVLVIGGGDGGTVLQLVKYPSIEKIIEVELDVEVVRVARKYFPRLASGYKDPRVQLRFADGLKYLRETEESFDIIILDLTDPIGPAKPLFEEPFFRLCSERLTKNGFLSNQSDSIYFDLEDIVKPVYLAMSGVFPIVEWVSTPLTMYVGNWWIFGVGSKQLDPTIPRNPFVPETKYYVRENHSWYFMPAPLRKKILAQN